ncbi:hypothetical protein ACJJTC_013863 [Scirpophaga incertulas]
MTSEVMNEWDTRRPRVAHSCGPAWSHSMPQSSTAHRTYQSRFISERSESIKNGSLADEPLAASVRNEWTIGMSEGCVGGWQHEFRGHGHGMTLDIRRRVRDTVQVQGRRIDQPSVAGCLEL